MTKNEQTSLCPKCGKSFLQSDTTLCYINASTRKAEFYHRACAPTDTCSIGEVTFGEQHDQE